jgi:TolB protein
LYNLKTGERKILVDDELMKEFPEWSPDGNWIVYQASAGDEFLYDIYKVEFATGKVARLTKEIGTDAQPSFSKDGSKIIFMSKRDTGTNNQTIYIMNADGMGVQRDVTADTGVHYPRLSVN